MTPSIHAINCETPTIALWLIQQRGQHDLDTADSAGRALHYASYTGLLAVVEALVAVDANPAALHELGSLSLMWASARGHTDIVAFLLHLPAVKLSIDVTDQDQYTALSWACRDGHQPIVQLLLDAGADPTIPAGPHPHSPLPLSLNNNRPAIAALLRHVIAMADTARALHKARSLLGAGAAALVCLQDRLEQGQAPPQLELTTPKQHQQQEQEPGSERFRATAAFAVGMAGGQKDIGLCQELYVELLGYMLHAWADKGPEA